MNIYIAADHRGFALKESLKGHLQAKSFTVSDCGNSTYDEADDYPDFAKAVAERVVADPGSFGVMICGSGNGMAIAANRISGIRAIVARSVEDARRGRAEENANIVALGADFTSEDVVKEIVSAFLETSASLEERHVRRRAKLS